MSWKKHFRVVNNKSSLNVSSSGGESAGGSSSKFSSYLPEVYAGHPNRIQRYYQYDDMDRDSDINAALDTIADFCTQTEANNSTPFEIDYDEGANETEVKIIKALLNRWVRLNDFRSRLWYMFRNVIKNGDAFFIRDPETSEWLWVDHYSVLMVKVDEENGKAPDEYIIKGLDYNKQAKLGTSKADMTNYNLPMGTSQLYNSRPLSGSGSTQTNFQMAGGSNDARQMRQHMQAANEPYVVDAKHVIHLSLSVGMDPNWPFGASVLEPIFKVYKQKELLEDAIIIYRTQRAPERRVFHIDVGDMPPPRAKAHLQAVKNEIHQRRIPNRTGGGTSILDAAYNPLSILEDFFFAQTADGRGSKVETLPGGDNLGEIGDLDYFTRKLARGMRIPTSYLAISDDNANVPYQDGKLGAAMIQEFRFNNYCKRLQSLLQPVFEKDFKRYVRENGVVVEPTLFTLRFNEPQNFTKYRQIELDQAQVGVYQMVADNKKISERIKFRDYLGWSEEKILENERFWREENPKKVKGATGSTEAEQSVDAGLSAVGIRPEPDFGFGMDDMPMDDAEAGMDAEMPPAGGPPGGAPPAGGGAPPAGGGAPPA